MNQQSLIAALSPALRKHVDLQAPAAMRMMAAKGAIPGPPRDTVLMLCVMSLDDDAALATTAKESIAQFPSKILGPVVEGEFPEAALEVICDLSPTRDDVLEKLVINRATPDTALTRLAPIASSPIVEILANNQERILRCTPLVLGLKKNPHILKSTLDRIFDFLVRAGIFIDDVADFSDALGRLSPSDIEKMTDKIAMPAEAAELLVETASAPIAEAVVASDEEAEAEDVNNSPPERIPILKMINNMSTAQKVALALKGNKEARTILVRASNKLIASAAIRSPRITEPEIIAAAKSRSVNEEVIRIIAQSKEMSRSYNVQVALANNPKTPMARTLKILTSLRLNDLKAISKSKNLPGAVVAAAKKMMQSKGS